MRLWLFSILAFVTYPEGSTLAADPSPVPDTIVRTDTPSGLPVPRFVSLKSNRTNCRSGPSLNHPKKLTYVRKGLPVRITAETTDHWRRIEDHDGDICWTHATLLSGITTALILNDKTSILATPASKARIRASVGSGVIVKVRRCKDAFCQVSAGKISGWILKDDLWGYRG